MSREQGTFSARTVTLLSLVVVLLAMPGAVTLVQAGPSCATAGTTGFTAKVVAVTGQTVSGTINATGCGVGIYVPPGANGVSIVRATITGANDHAILAEAVTGLIISGNTVTGNGVAPVKGVADDKAIEVEGATNAIVKSNQIFGNNNLGGIAVTDDGPINPGAPSQSVNNTVSARNLVEFNLINDTSPSNCGIVVAGFNAHDSVVNTTVVANKILGNSPEFPGPGDGQIVVATDGPLTTVTGTVIRGNTLEGSLLPGIVLHANVPGSVISSTSITNNVVIDAGVYPSAYATAHTPTSAAGNTGIALINEASAGQPVPPVIKNTYVVGNLIFNNAVTIWTCQTSGTFTAANIANTGTTAACAAGP